MRIEHVLIHNFRGVIHQGFTLNPYTLLIGGNNAGKSTIIDACARFTRKINIPSKNPPIFHKRERKIRRVGLKYRFC